MLIGYDILFPEAARSLAKWGVDIVAVPSAWYYKEWQWIWRITSLEQNIHLVVSNQYGKSWENLTFTGGSTIFEYESDPVAARVRNFNGDTVKLSTLYTGKVRDKKNICLTTGGHIWYDTIVKENPKKEVK
jgi:predicted amidohydrolase